jgi:hypothetical protein
LNAGVALAAAAAAKDAAQIRDLHIQVTDAPTSTVDRKLTVDENFSLTLNEDWTLFIDLATTFSTSPKHHIVSLDL